MVAAYVQTTGREVLNNSGGLVFAVGDRERLERFLILGTVGGTYYVNEREHTNENLKAIERIVDEMGSAAVDLIREVGVSNRAPKHDHVLVAYAIVVANPKTSAYALQFFNEIVRTGTHLFHFLEYSKGRRGWGRAFKRAIANWYLDRSPMSLANQLVKYKARDGWSQRDVLRKAHPVSTNPTVDGLLHYAVKGTLLSDESRAHAFVEAAIEASQTTDVARAVKLIEEFDLPREVLNTKIMTDKRIWAALAPRMGMTALLRNLRNMHKDGYLIQGTDAVKTVRERLIDAQALKQARIHPAHVFLAQKNAENIPMPVQHALEDAFYLSFGNVKPTNKRIMLALDVSGSMSWSPYGMSLATAREWSALMAMVTARTEPYAEFRAFHHRLVPINITARDSLTDVVRKVSSVDFGSTRCDLPMISAMESNEKFDAFCVYTDNETNTGGSPSVALHKYRKASGIHDAKLAVVAVTSTGFSIADPQDAGMLDFVGFDANAPAIMADFIRG